MTWLTLLLLQTASPNMSQLLLPVVISTIVSGFFALVIALVSYFAATRGKRIDDVGKYREELAKRVEDLETRASNLENEKQQLHEKRLELIARVKQLEFENLEGKGQIAANAAQIALLREQLAGMSAEADALRKERARLEAELRGVETIYQLVEHPDRLVQLTALLKREKERKEKERPPRQGAPVDP